MGVFDQNVFDANVFDISDTNADLVIVISLDGESPPRPQGPRIGVNLGGSGRPLRVGKLKMPKMPSFPKAPSSNLTRSIPKIEFREYEPLQSEREQTEERWRRWQASPAAAGKGSASILEFLVWEFLTYKKKQIENVDWIYQYPLMGGRTRFGGFVADFYFPMRREVWNPAGLQFHWTDPQDRARDLMAKQVLAGRGIRLLYLWEDDLMNRPDYTLEQAWRGVELPR